MHKYDLTYSDFNPTIFYSHKERVVKNGVYHSHDYPEMTCILSGKCKYFIEGKVYDVSAGDIIMCNPGVKHQNIVINPEDPTIEFFTGFLNVHFLNMQQNCITFKDNEYIMHTTAELRQEVIKCCYEMDAENAANKAGRYYMQKANLIKLLILIVRENMEEYNFSQSGYIFKSSNKSYVVKKIITYLNENYNSKISLDQIAHNMYLSPVYISKIFKEETGESPINYLIKIRLEKASDILKNEKDRSIKSIANSVGYDDVYYFSKLFKKYYGISPLHYKKKI